MAENLLFLKLMASKIYKFKTFPQAHSIKSIVGHFRGTVVELFALWIWPGGGGGEERGDSYVDMTGMLVEIFKNNAKSYQYGCSTSIFDP